MSDAIIVSSDLSELAGSIMKTSASARGVGSWTLPEYSADHMDGGQLLVAETLDGLVQGQAAPKQRKRLPRSTLHM